MRVDRRQLGGFCLVGALSALVGVAPAASVAEAWAPLLAQPGGGLQRLSLPWDLLQAAPLPQIESVQVLDAQGQVYPSAWASTPPDEPATRQLPLPHWAWPEAADGGDPPALSQLRIELDQQGRVLRLQAGTAGRLHRASGGGHVWLLDLTSLQGRPERARSLQLDWASAAQGQALSVQIEGSEDLQRWRALRSAQLLDLPPDAGSPALQLKHVDWPADQPLPRYLRLRFDQALQLQAGVLSLETRRRPALQTQALSWPAVPAQGKDAAHWRLDLALPLRPEALQVQLPDLNQLLSLRLEQRQQEGQPWRLVQRFVAWRMLRRGVEAQAPAEPVQAGPARQWRLVAEGPVPASLAQSALRLHWHWRPPELVTLLPAEPRALAGMRVRLASQLTAGGRLPLPSLMPGYQDGAEYQLPEARLGAPQSTPASAPAPAWQDPTTRKRWGLWAVLGFSVLGLAGLAWRLKSELGSHEQDRS